MGVENVSLIDIVVACMTGAFVSYLAALFLAPKTKKHIICAVIGFSLDMYATYLMETYGRAFVSDFSKMLLYTHTALAGLAILLFLTIASLGARRNPKHPVLARFLFLPVWVASYLSGLFLIY